MLSYLLFIYGLFVGSFLNVVIYRLPKNESIVFPPSHCPQCRHKIAFYDLIPVISYLILGGKCRHCKQSISFIYPFVEILTGLLFFSIFQFLPIYNYVTLIYLLVMMSVFIVVFFTDLKYGIIPFQVVLLGLIAVLTYLIYIFSFAEFINHFLAGIGAFIAFLLLFLFTKGKGMGFGDVVLVFLIGLFLGFPKVGIAIYIAFLTGAVISLILVLIGIKKIKHDSIPFGPFLVSGTLLSLFFGNYFMRLIMVYLPL